MRGRRLPTLRSVRVGLQMIFQSWGYGPSVTDSQVVREEVELGILADSLGFDALWPVEHHFDDYAFCPDNTLLLAHLAGRTERIGLGTGAVILPWNDPLRVAEKLALLDHLTAGRLRFGMGRGLARCEYAGFGIRMDESRDRFDEAAPMILSALETGFIEGAGPNYPQPRVAIRPRPEWSFRGRTYCVANVARLGAGCGGLGGTDGDVQPASLVRPGRLSDHVRRAICRRAAASGMRLFANEVLPRLPS